ncbi:MAG: ATP-dependent Clp protease proteolytic subunit [Gemmatimonadota bacterium]|nr:ATP-dependent Clp protease proteolytic subunit [Gemmatimonadota bacterium]
MSTTTLQRPRKGLSSVAVAGLSFALLASLSAGGPGRADAQDAADTVVRVPITGTIELGLAPFVARSLTEAEAAGASAVILDLDTPGGRVDAAWKIIDDVREADIPVYAYVNRRALSAGAMIALAADRLYMRPGSTIGAATPVVGDGQKASEKMVSAMRSEFRALAEQRGFDPRLAEAMVDESVEVEGVVDAGKLLTLTTDEAIELGVAHAEVEDLADLLNLVELPAAATVDSTPNWAEAIVRFLTNPAVAPMLLSLGFLGLLIEIRTPTFGVAGAIGLGALAAFFGAHHLVHLAGMEEIILFAAGVVLVAVEVFVIPGTGIVGFLGGGAIITGAALGMVGQVPSAGDIVNAAGLVALSLILVAVAGWALLRYLPSSRRLSGVFLRDSTSRDTGYLSAPEREDLVGATGIAVTDLRPAGTAVVGEERIDVVTEGPWISADTPIEILRAESYRHIVRPLEVADGESVIPDQEGIEGHDDQKSD